MGWLAGFGTVTIWDYILLVGLVCFIYYLWMRRTWRRDSLPRVQPALPPLKKQDMTLAQLCQFDGRMPDGRTLIAVDGKIFDVSRAKHLYGPDGPYGLFAGHDASRGLATFSIDDSAIKKEYDDLSDLSMSEIESMKEWAAQFKEKYPVVGRLLKPGEEPDIYSSETDSEQGDDKNAKRKASASKAKLQEEKKDI